MSNRLIRSLKKRWRILTNPEFRRYLKTVRKFKREQGRATPAAFEGMTSNSVAFDIGGYTGIWTDDMRRLYDCHVHVFEPHPHFSAELAAKFADDPKVTCHAFALGAEDGELELYDVGDASSAFLKQGSKVTGEIRAVTNLFKELDIAEIDATEINIEGGEYDILPALIESGLITRFRSLVIQFHNYGTGEVQQRNDIRRSLQATHRCLWNYDFVWEKWERR